MAKKKAKAAPPPDPQVIFRALPDLMRQGRAGEIAQAEVQRLARDHPDWMAATAPGMIRVSLLTHIVHTLRKEGLDDPRTVVEG